MKPLTRKEIFLAKIAGEDVDIEPLTREEVFLNQIAESGGGGGGGIVCECDFDEQQEHLTARMTAGDLFNAFMQGNHVVLHASTESPLGVSHLCYALVSATHIDGYSFWILVGEQIINFGADSADDYPIISMD